MSWAGSLGGRRAGRRVANDRIGLDQGGVVLELASGPPGGGAGRYTGRLIFGKAGTTGQGLTIDRYGDPPLTKYAAISALPLAVLHPLIDTMAGSFTLSDVIGRLVKDVGGAHRMQQELLRAGGHDDAYDQAGAFAIGPGASWTADPQWGKLTKGQWGDSFWVPVVSEFDVTLVPRARVYRRPTRAQAMRYLDEQPELVMAAGGIAQALRAFYAQPQWQQMEQLEWVAELLDS